jgi:multiple sugar transport system ATP-binding protein
MDEPLSNLDAKLRVQMRTQISRLQQRLGSTTVYVTHDQTEAMTLGDRVVVLRGGLVQQIGTPQRLYEQPKNLFVAGFIGSPAMNFLHATTEDNRLRTSVGVLDLSDRLRRTLERHNAPRDLIVGLRPEAFEDAALVDRSKAGGGTTFSVDIDVVESLGSDVYAYFTEDEWQPTATSELAELAADSGLTDTGAGAHQIVTRLDASTQVREGGRAELWVDTAKLHVFDPASGANLTLSDEAAD